MHYCKKTKELQFTSASEYLQACMILRDYHARVLFTAVDVKFLRSVVRKFVTLSELSFLLPESNTLKLDAAPR